MSRAEELRSALSRCEQRAQYAERELSRYAVDCDLTDPMQERRRRKLHSDWDRAVRDCEWIKEQIGRAGS